MALTIRELNEQWRLFGPSPDWYSVYNWDRLGTSHYTELVATIILANYTSIILCTEGLRESKPFRLLEHDGRAKLKPSHVEQFNQTGHLKMTEDRYVRAIYNKGRVELLGEVVDYQVPLKQTQGALHGKVDLLSRIDSQVLVIEAKVPESKESMLKAVLQAFVYTRLLHLRRKKVIREYGWDETVSLQPAVLTFAGTASGCEIRNHHRLPNVLALLQKLNDDLRASGLPSIRFFVSDASNREVMDSLALKYQENGLCYPVFKDDHALRLSEVSVE